jgi:hypothetical protein
VIGPDSAAGDEEEGTPAKVVMLNLSLLEQGRHKPADGSTGQHGRASVSLLHPADALSADVPLAALPVADLAPAVLMPAADTAPTPDAPTPDAPTPDAPTADAAAAGVTTQDTAAAGATTPDAAAAGLTTPDTAAAGATTAAAAGVTAPTAADADRDTDQDAAQGAVVGEQVPEVRPPDPAEIVADIRWRLDVSTLREVVDDQAGLREVAERLAVPLSAATDNHTRARVLCLRAEVCRLLGDVDRAAAAARLAVAHGEAGGQPQARALAQAELAQVLRLRGDYGEADALFRAVVDADVPDAVRSMAHENAGRCCVDQGRYLEAFDHFGRALRLGGHDDLELIARLEVCLDAVHLRVLRDGWGPSPRDRAEIMAGGDPRVRKG